MAMKKTKEYKALAALNDLVKCYNDDPALTKQILNYFPDVKKFLQDILNDKSTAQKMFEKLGYKKVTLPFVFEYRLNLISHSLMEEFVVEFNLLNKSYTLHSGHLVSSIELNGELHQAITQQMKELGWI